MTKLLQISALTALTLLFGACDTEMTDGDVETRDFHGKRLDIADADGDYGDDDDDDDDDDADDDSGFIIDDDFADAEPVPAPIVEYDLTNEDEEPCDSWGPDDDVLDGGDLVADEDEDEDEGDLDLDFDLEDEDGDEDVNPLDGDLPLGLEPDHSDDTWGPDEDLDLDHGDVEPNDDDDDA